MHPYVVGEFACGNFKDGQRTLADLKKLPKAPIADDVDVYYLLDAYQLWGTGLGWIDMHVLTAAALTGWSLMTKDSAMRRAAHKAGIPLA